MCLYLANLALSCLVKTLALPDCHPGKQLSPCLIDNAHEPWPLLSLPQATHFAALLQQHKQVLSEPTATQTSGSPLTSAG